MKFKYSLACISSIMMIAGCSNSNDRGNMSTYTLSGTVPGTIIEAQCSDGAFYQTESTQDGTAEHPFELEIPQGSSCKVVMITNETAANPADWIYTPLDFSANGTSGSYLEINQDIDLQFVPLETNGTSGVQGTLTVTIESDTVTASEPANDPLDDDDDGVPNLYEDDDNDGQLNRNDDDDDGDGIPDMQDRDGDYDHDGIADLDDVDDDNDGIHDDDDDDDDNDGVRDSEDHDYDNDGIDDDLDDDDDNDGIIDAIDTDDDNDGIPDLEDTDDNNDGVDDEVEGESEEEDDSLDSDDNSTN